MKRAPCITALPVSPSTLDVLARMHDDNNSRVYKHCCSSVPAEEAGAPRSEHEHVSLGGGAVLAELMPCVPVELHYSVLDPCLGGQSPELVKHCLAHLLAPRLQLLPVLPDAHRVYIVQAVLCTRTTKQSRRHEDQTLTWLRPIACGRWQPEKCRLATGGTILQIHVNSVHTKAPLSLWRHGHGLGVRRDAPVSSGRTCTMWKWVVSLGKMLRALRKAARL